MTILILAAVVACVSGAVASVSGFGIGSILTPLLATGAGTKTAVAAVAIPHFFGTAIRAWMLRAHIDKKVLLSFGITSAAGGLAGAILHGALLSRTLTVVFGVVLIFAGIAGLTGWIERMQLDGWKASVAGALSGALGGVVGNQGGIRSAALLGFKLEKDAFVATTTAVGLMVDLARVPVYFFLDLKELLAILPIIAVASAGVIAGTFLGLRLLKNVPQQVFKQVVSVIIILLGIWMLLQRE